MARNCPEILICAYFYARFNPAEGLQPPSSWSAYIKQFFDPTHLNRPDGKKELKRYFLSTFRMQYESPDELEALSALKERNNFYIELPLISHLERPLRAWLTMMP